jgi:hypothetical protein
VTWPNKAELAVSFVANPRSGASLEDGQPSSNKRQFASLPDGMRDLAMEQFHEMGPADLADLDF